MWQESCESGELRKEMKTKMKFVRKKKTTNKQKNKIKKNGRTPIKNKTLVLENAVPVLGEKPIRERYVVW